MSSATTSYVEHAVDLYREIYGNEMERQSDVYTQNHMELFEKVWVAGGGSTAKEEQDERDRIAAMEMGQGKKKLAATKHRQEQGRLLEGQVDDSAINIPNDWPEIPGQDPSTMVWTCDICEMRMSVFSRSEHIASEHPPKAKQSPRPRRQRKKAGGEGGMPTWQCELCDEEVNIFYTAEHVAGKKHVMKLKESGEPQYIPPSDEFVEQRAVYRPQDGEEVLGGVEEEEDWGLGKGQGGKGYLEESAVYRPDEEGEAQDDWVPRDIRGGSESLGTSTIYQPEDGDDDEDWEAQDNKVYRPLAEDPWGLEQPKKAGALKASVSNPGQEKLAHPGPSYQNYIPKVTDSQPKPPLLSQTYQTPVHIQVETFYCDLCDTEYPMSERKFHSDQTFECRDCEDEFHFSTRSDHLASREHIRCVEAKGGIVKTSMPQAGELQTAAPPKVAAFFHCELCGITMQMDSRGSHLAGIKHRTKQQTIEAEQAARKAKAAQAILPRNASAIHAKLNGTVPPIAPRALLSPTKKFYCSLCHLIVNSDSREAHVATVGHRALSAAHSNQQSVSKPNPPVMVPIRSRANNPPLQAAAQPGSSNKMVPGVEKETFHCDICDMTMVMGARPSHLGGLRHKANEAVRAAEQAAKNNREAGAPQTIVESGGKLRCRPCGITLGQKDLETHLSGKKHIANTTQATVEGPGAHGNIKTPPTPPMEQDQFHCKPCNMVLPIDNLQIHVAGKRHKKNELAYKPQITKNVVSEMVLTKVGGDVVVDVKLEPDMNWCEICLKNISEREREVHGSGMWRCRVCNVKTHSAWREMHQGTASHRVAESRKSGA